MKSAYKIKQIEINSSDNFSTSYTNGKTILKGVKDLKIKLEARPSALGRGCPDRDDHKTIIVGEDGSVHLDRTVDDVVIRSMKDIELLTIAQKVIAELQARALKSMVSPAPAATTSRPSQGWGRATAPDKVWISQEDPLAHLKDFSPNF
jgi:hypothetical protein